MDAPPSSEYTYTPIIVAVKCSVTKQGEKESDVGNGETSYIGIHLHLKCCCEVFSCIGQVSNRLSALLFAPMHSLTLLINRCRCRSPRFCCRLPSSSVTGDVVASSSFAAVVVASSSVTSYPHRWHHWHHTPHQRHHQHHTWLLHHW
jgi:hypothetical protein